MRYVKEFEKDNSNTKLVSLDEIIAHPELYTISSIDLDPTIIINDEITIMYVDKEHPVSVINDALMGNCIGIEQEYFNNNKEQIITKLESLFKVINAFYMLIPTELMSTKILKSLCSNPNIKMIKIGSKSNPYTLTLEDYEIVKNSNIESIDTNFIVPELETVYDSKIEYNNRKKLILDKNYTDIITSDSLYINRPLTEEEINNLCFIKEGTKIQFEKFNDYDNIFTSINKLRSYNKNYTFRIVVESKDNYNYKNKFNDYIFNHPEYIDNEITIVTEITTETNLKDYIKYEKRLYELVKPALNLSPLEKFLFAYNIAKKYKPYKENEQEKEKSRRLYEVLDGDYMVCVGFSKLLQDLLNKLDINCSGLSVGVDIGFDNVPIDAEQIPEDVLTKSGGHARLKVHIVDPKYGIDGIYNSDPTWDNVLEEDTYNYALMTQDEYNHIRRYNFMNFYNVDELYAVHSLEEFYYKVNVWLDKFKDSFEEFSLEHHNRNIEDFRNSFKIFMSKLKEVDPKNYEWYNSTYKNLYSTKVFATNIPRFMTRIQNVLKSNNNYELIKAYNDLKDKYSSLEYSKIDGKKTNNKKNRALLQYLIDSLKEIDPKKYREFFEKYPEIRGYEFKVSDEYMKNCLYDIGEYIVSKSNNLIEGETLISAIRYLYENVYNTKGEELDSTIQHIIEVNKKRQEICFPQRYKIDRDGNKEPYPPLKNKFDLEVVDKKTF